MRKVLHTTVAAMIIATSAPAALADAATGRCKQYETMLLELAPAGGWNILKMSRTMWRESRCQPTAVNRRGGDSGLLQIHPVSWQWLAGKMGTTVNRQRLLDPEFNIRAAAALCTFWRKAGSSCYRPWSGGA